MIVLRLWSDFGLDPFYIDGGVGFFDLTDNAAVAERFDLPAELIREVKAWDGLYQRRLCGSHPWSNPWPTATAHQEYLDRGREVARLLRRHLPADVTIEYLADESVREYY